MDEDENVDLVSNEEDDLEESIIYRTCGKMKSRSLWKQRYGYL